MAKALHFLRFKVAPREAVPRILGILALTVAVMAWGYSSAVAQPAPPQPVREIFVPFEDLNVLLDAAPQRVFLTRAEYEALLAKAQAGHSVPPPANILLLGAEYTIALEESRARISGELEIDVLGSGLQAVELELEGVGVLAAQWIDDEQTAALGRNPAGRAVLFVEGPARRRLRLELTAPLVTSAAQQTLALQLPASAIARFDVTAPGDVELKQGAEVVERKVNEAGLQTQFELAAPPGPLSLVFSLNNRMQQRERVMLARSVLIDEVAVGVERLHATITFHVLHGAAEEFQLAVPEDFEITDVHCDPMARWSTAPGTDGDKLLKVELREAITASTTLTITGVRLARSDEGWAFPVIQPLHTAGHAAVLGLLVEQGMRIEDVDTEGLVPIDRDVLNQAFAAAALRRDSAALPTRPVLAYYAPQADYRLSAQFEKPPQQLEVVTNLVLQLSDSRQEMLGVFSLSPKIEPLFSLHFRAPPGWQVTSVRDSSGTELAFERFRLDEGTRIQVRLPQAIPPGTALAVEFSAFHIPDGWLDTWDEQRVTFPAFEVENAAREIGAVSVRSLDDFAVRPEILEQLSPLNDDERHQFGLDQQAELAFRFDQRPFAATFHVQRLRPNITARALTFFRIEKTGLQAYAEIEYELREATTRRLQLSLPASTPAELSIQGRDSTIVKQFHARLRDDRRVWDVLLAENVPLDQEQTGRATLAITWQQSLPQEVRDYVLPIVEAEGVEYQTGYVSVEGDAELETRVATDARKVDVGEMAAAEYAIGRNLLGAFGYLGTPVPISVSVNRRALHPLPGAIIEHARLGTMIATSGQAQTNARFDLRTKALLLEVLLPKGAELWSVLVDDEPASPQREGQVVLINLVAAHDRPVRTIEIAYGFPTATIHLAGRVRAAAPQLRLPGEKDEPSVIVPLGDVQWQLLLPKGYEVTHSFGTVDADVFAAKPRHPFQLTQATYGAIFSGAGDALAPAAADYTYYAERESRSGAAPPAGEAPEALAKSAAPADGEAPTADFAVPAREPDAPQQPEAPAAEFDDTTNSPMTGPGSELAQPQAPLTGTALTAGGRGEKTSSEFDLLGVRSLRVDVDRVFRSASSEQVTEFHSLGENAFLSVRVLHRSKLYYLAWAVGLSVGLIGVLLTDRPWRLKLGFLALIVVLALIVPALTDWSYEMQDICGAAVLAASLLLPYYLFMAVVRLLVRLLLRSGLAVRRLLPASAALLLMVFVTHGAVRGQQLVEFGDAAQDARVLPPVQLPTDAIIVPYDAASNVDPRHQDNRLLVPYEQYVELWNRAYPDKPIGTSTSPAEYAVGAAQYEVTLAGDTDLTIKGTIELHSYTAESTVVYLPFGGSVVVAASLDGQPARMQLITAKPEEPGTANLAAGEAPPAMLSVVVTGKGRKVLTLELRASLDRQGGWRKAEARLPMGTVGALTLTAPEANTEVRLGGVADKPAWETEAAGERITTALLPSAPLVVQWRPKVAEGQVDAALTVDSTATLDVQEDGLQLVWQLTLQFRRGRREEFQITVPEGYLVEKVLGENVRGWSSEMLAEQRTLRVTLLRPATDREQITLGLSKRWELETQATSFAAPVVKVEGAALQQGTLTIRRSVLLDLRTRDAGNLTRTELDVAQAEALIRAAGTEERPLPLAPYQAFRFSHPDYALQLEARLLEAKAAVATQAILRVSERRSTLELQHVFRVERTPLHQIEIELPPKFELERISEPEYVITEEPTARVLTVYLASGQTGEFRIAIAGSLGSRLASDPVALPRIRVRNIERQEGQLVVQVDPAYRVRTESLNNVEAIPLEQTFAWLNEQQRELARSGQSFAWQSADYAGQLLLARREPLVRCSTLTNVHVTRQAIEETILLEFRVAEAGVQRVQFLLPQRLEKARFRVPALRQKTIELGVGSDEEPRLRVTLDFQDELMDVIRIVVEHDQVLSLGPYTAPLPVIETGEVTQQYVTLQNSSRDEVKIVERTGIEELVSQQDQWRALADLDVTQGYLVQRGSVAPRLVLQAQPRLAVETVGARIGLSEAVLVLDGHGAFRAVQEFRVENSTEQYLEIALPQDAQLWTVHVAGQPAKPARPRGGGSDHVRIPLVKTEAGDADYPVRIVYAGKLPSLTNPTRVQFPLARTVNIHVELSQVTLYLPESHRWFNFRGARKLESRADYAQGYESYYEDQVLRASRVISSGSEFDRSRAKQNLQKLERTLQSNRTMYERFDGNAALSAQNYANLMLLEEAQQQLAEQEGMRVQQQVDNRDQLKKVWGEQHFRRSTNIAANSEENFRYRAEADLAQQGTQRFNQRWFAENKLGDTVAGKPEGPAVVDQQWDGLASSDEKQTELRDLGAAIQQRRGVEQLESKLAATPPQVQLDERQMGLAMDGQAAAQPQPQFRAGMGGIELEMGGAAGAATFGGGMGAAGGMGGGGGSGGRPEEAAPAMPGLAAPSGPVLDYDALAAVSTPVSATGLASLEFTLPQRGEPYYFRATRGEVTITAQAVPQSLVSRFLRLGCGIALALGVAWALRRRR